MSSSISEEEIEREVRTLKNLRRRSVSAPGPGDLALDPDLPPPDAFSTGPSYSSNDDVTLATPDGLDGDAGLFWVPAHLHPELAPGEFRAFLKQHTQVDPGAVESGETGEAALARSPSWLARNNSLSGALGRKKSMLSRQYTPRAGDKVEDEAPPVPVRRPSMYAGRNADKGLTLHDLQKLEELVEDADLSDDPEKMRKMLRRSLSMNVAPGFLEETPQGERSEADAPIVVPRPGSIIRRTARTKIRKGGPGEGGSRRFSSTRRGRLTSPSSGAVDQVEEGDSMRSEDRRSDETESEEQSSESPHASLTSSDSVVADSARPPAPALASTKLPVPPHPQVVHQPPSPDLGRASEDEALIYDAYAGDRTSTSTSSSLSLDDPSRSPSPDSRTTAPSSERVHTPPNLPPIVTPKPGEAGWFEDDELTPTQESSMSAALHAMSLLPSSGPSEDIFQQQQQPHKQPAAPARKLDAEVEPKTPTAARPYAELPPGMAPPSQRVAPPPSIVVPQRNGQLQVPTLERPSLTRTDSAASSSSNASSVASAGKEKLKEKEKKGGLFSKKSHSHDKDKGEKKKKEKDRFLGSLFGNKKKHEEASSVSNFATAGPAAAAALLGTSKSAKSLHAAGSGTSSPTSPGFSNFARYPIHVERAVYRLSHIKLANARRPLIEQVLISNLMFWYLGVIGRTAGPTEDKKPGSVNGIDRERDEQLRTPPLKGTPSKPADSGSAGVKQPDQPLAPGPLSPRKAGLSKPERSRGNNNEAAYRAPQYGMQTAQMDKEMRGPPHTKQQSQHSQQQHSPTHQHQQPPQQYQPQSAAPPPRTASMTASPGRVRSPPPNGQPQQYPPGVAPPARPAMPQSSSSYGMQGGGHQRPVAVPEGRDPRRPQPPPGGQHGPHPAQPGVRPGQQYPPNGADPRRSGEGRPYPQQHSSSGSGGGSAGGPQPGQLFQYPGSGGGGGGQYGRPGGPAAGQHYSAQPGQIFHHPQFQQRPPGSGVPPNWEPPQRLPPGQQQRAPGPALAQGPPRRTSSNTQDPYGRQGGPAYGGGGGGSRDGQTSPTNQGFYSQRNPGQPAYPYPPSGGGQARPQPVPSGQYPHHR
ncbi:hypothetical protein Q8F55_008702 [Vanrija albida]|uniref:Protein Zds1 C-terminal domain-containing protein n=1 Tax=Vanrija albida TaxID=181172 RepID=A0ABR3PRM1_9TREE